MIDKGESRRIRGEIRRVLMTVWDPIGVREEPNAQDEYDSYLGGVFDLLASEASDDRISEHLWRIVTERMELPAKKEDMKSTVLALRQIQLTQEQNWSLAGCVIDCDLTEFALPIPPPRVGDNYGRHHKHHQVRPPHDLQQPLPMLSKEVPHARDDGHPQRRPQKVEQHEASPGHAQHTGQWTGDHSHPENEARKEYCHRAVSLEQLLAALDLFVRYPEQPLIVVQQGTSAVMSNPVAEVVAQRTCQRADENDQSKIEFVVLKGKEAGKQQHGLAGQRNARVLQHQRDRECPVTVGGEVVSQHLEQVGQQDHARPFSTAACVITTGASVPIAVAGVSRSRKSRTMRVNSCGRSSYGMCPMPSIITTALFFHRRCNCSADSGSTAVSRVPQSSSTGTDSTTGRTASMRFRPAIHARIICHTCS